MFSALILLSDLFTIALIQSTSVKRLKCINKFLNIVMSFTKKRQWYFSVHTRCQQFDFLRFGIGFKIMIYDSCYVKKKELTPLSLLFDFLKYLQQPMCNFGFYETLCLDKGITNADTHHYLNVKNMNTESAYLLSYLAFLINNWNYIFGYMKLNQLRLQK